MFKKCIAIFMVCVGFTFLVFADCVKAGEVCSPCPPEKCIECHSVGAVYAEWSNSKHGEYETVDCDGKPKKIYNAHCADCHIPGKIQEECSILDEGEKEGFHILGYVTFDCTSGVPLPTGHRIKVTKQVCQRCHDDAHHAKGNKDCCDCHMTSDGLTTYRVHAYPKDAKCDTPQHPDHNLFDILRFVTREHRSHTFKPDSPDLGTP